MGKSLDPAAMATPTAGVGQLAYFGFREWCGRSRSYTKYWRYSPMMHKREWTNFIATPAKGLQGAAAKRSLAMPPTNRNAPTRSARSKVTTLETISTRNSRSSLRPCSYSDGRKAHLPSSDCLSDFGSYRRECGV